jgi:hypothetical protein
MLLSDAYYDIRDGDLLLYRGRGPVNVIGVGRDSAYRHAAMAAFWGPDLMLLEMVASGGRAVTLESQVRAYPGRWDWFQANPGNRWSWRAGETVAAMRRFAGTPYGWWNLARTAVRHLPIVRLFTPPIVEAGATNGRNLKPYCSQAISVACRAGGVDPVPGVPDWQTQPADLARSHFFRFMATLE